MVRKWEKEKESGMRRRTNNAPRSRSNHFLSGCTASSCYVVSAAGVSGLTMRMDEVFLDFAGKKTTALCSSFLPAASASRSALSRRSRRSRCPTLFVATPHWQFPPLPSPSRLYTIAFTSFFPITPLRPEQDQHRPTTPLLFSPALEMDSFASTSSATGAHGAGGGGNKRAATPSGAGPKVPTRPSPPS
jgi:hypothetical protein